MLNLEFTFTIGEDIDDNLKKKFIKRFHNPKVFRILNIDELQNLLRTIERKSNLIKSNVKLDLEYNLSKKFLNKNNIIMLNEYYDHSVKGSTINIYDNYKLKDNFNEIMIFATIINYNHFYKFILENYGTSHSYHQLYCYAYKIGCGMDLINMSNRNK